MKSVFLAAVILLFSPNIKAERFNFMPPAWRNATNKKPETRKLKIPKWAVDKKPKKKSAWSGFWNSLKFKDYNSPKIHFEIGTMAYLYKNRSLDSDGYRSSWELSRFEPFIKIQWAILDKYLQPYFLIALEKTTLRYKISNFKIDSNNTLDFDTKITSGGTPFFGAGLQFFIIGWQNFNLYGYAQLQITSLNDAEVEEMRLTLNNSAYDIMALAKGNFAITHHIQRYDCGAIFSWRPIPWLTASASFGYNWFYVKVRIDVAQEFIDYANFVQLGDPRQIIPKEKRLNNNTFFALFGLKIKIYKRLYLNVSGTMLPGDNPFYYGQLSVLFEGDK